MKEKKQISIFLMVVGVVFIVIAGGIFVTTAWKYLLESGKRMLLFGSMVGLFTASVKVSGNPKLKRTERLLFYLGVVFTGFFTLSVMTGLFGQDTLFFHQCILYADGKFGYAGTCFDQINGLQKGF